MVAVGYDNNPADGSKPYFKLRNTWGKTWGEEGYIKIA
jgi:C1A family cysteine protease